MVGDAQGPADRRHDRRRVRLARDSGGHYALLGRNLPPAPVFSMQRVPGTPAAVLVASLGSRRVPVHVSPRPVGGACPLACHSKGEWQAPQREMIRVAHRAPRRRRAAQVAAVLLGLTTAWVALSVSPAEAKRRPPKPVPAWYMTAANVTDLVRQAKNSACTFAKRQPKGSRLMLFDFGAAQKYRDGTYGASLREIRRFRNGGILKALKGAARKYHHCHRRGSATIAYGNTNSMPGYMNKADAYEAGLHQAATMKRLHRFQSHEKHYRNQSVATAGDIEPGFGFPGVSKALVRGANGATTYYDFGNAGGCPGQPGSRGCHNGWDLGDLGDVSMGGRLGPASGDLPSLRGRSVGPGAGPLGR